MKMSVFCALAALLWLVSVVLVSRYAPGSAWTWLPGGILGATSVVLLGSHIKEWLSGRCDRQRAE